MPGNSRLGPIASAIKARDSQALLDAIRSRCRVDPTTGHWIWLGRKSPEGYPMTGRSGSAASVHRLAAWTIVQMRGELADYPSAAHQCSVRWCCNPAHVFFTPQYLNVLEMKVRVALTQHIDVLTEEVRRLDPGNRVLGTFPMGETPLPAPPLPGSHYLSPRRRRKLEEARAQSARDRDANRVRRFQEVKRAGQLMEAGLTLAEALKLLGLSRSVYDLWAPRYAAWLEQGGDDEVQAS